jgi:tetratricopeptide (TPR) repeat protein
MASPLTNGPLVAEGWRALELFTDRRPIIRRYAERLHATTPSRPVLYLHGEGGNGKSLLLRFLRRKCTRLLGEEAWAGLARLDDEMFVQRLLGAPADLTIPSAIVDFSLDKDPERNPRNPFHALLQLRRELAPGELPMPSFDYACVWYLYRTGRLTNEWLQALFPVQASNLAAAVLKLFVASTAAAMIGVGAALLALLNDSLRKQFTLYSARLFLEQSVAEQIQSLERDGDLLDALPGFFAADLSAAFELPDTPPRAVLLFDSHDALWGPGDYGTSRDRFFYRDEWLRRLVLGLNHPSICTVIVGREPPAWQAAARFQVPDSSLEVVHVGPLERSDATVYLNLAEVRSPAMQDWMISEATVSPGLVHPFYLALLVDASQFARIADSGERPDEVTDHARSHSAVAFIDRLLRNVTKDQENAIRALSVCRWFDFETFVALGKTLHFETTQAGFERLTSLSFVWPAESAGKLAWRIHALVARLIANSADSAQVVRTHRILARRFLARRAIPRTIGDVIEGLYHVAYVSPLRAARLWIDYSVLALQAGSIELVRALLDLRLHLPSTPESLRGAMANTEGDLYLALGRPQEATEAARAAITAFDQVAAAPEPGPHIACNRAVSLLVLGRAERMAGHDAAADSAYREALIALRKVARSGEEHPHVLSDLGEALLGVAAGNRARHGLKSVTKLVREAVRVYGQAIETDEPRARQGQVNALIALSRLQSVRRDTRGAQQSLVQAFSAFRKLKSQSTFSVNDIMSYAHVWSGLARLHLGADQIDEARTASESAIRLYRLLLKRQPESLPIVLNATDVLLRQSDIEVDEDLSR